MNVFKYLNWQTNTDLLQNGTNLDKIKWDELAWDEKWDKSRGHHPQACQI